MFYDEERDSERRRSDESGPKKRKRISTNEKYEKVKIGSSSPGGQRNNRPNNDDPNQEDYVDGNREGYDDANSRYPSRSDNNTYRENNGYRKPYRDQNDNNRPQRGYDNRDRSYNRRDDNERPYNRRDDNERSFNRRDDGERSYNRRDSGERSYNRRDGGERSFNRRDDNERSYNRQDNNDRSYNRQDRNFNRDDRPYSREGRESYGDRNFNRDNRSSNRQDRPFNRQDRPFRKPGGKPGFKRYDDRPQRQPYYNFTDENENKPIRLNKFIANSGICSRREADEYIQAGLITINGNLVTELGVKVLPTDDIKYNGSQITPEKKVYILLNKPKDYVTSVDDPHAKRTIMELVKGACRERIYPVGRLDRMTTGVIMLTNDGDLTKKLTHPTSEIKKIYQVQLDKNLSHDDLLAISEGITLDDGFIKVDQVSYLKDKDKNFVGIEIHSGKNRIVRRIFEQIGYKVVRLDRVFFAGLTKKGLSRGDWRYLAPREVGFLKMMKV